MGLFILTETGTSTEQVFEHDEELRLSICFIEDIVIDLVGIKNLNRDLANFFRLLI
jgi:hypothetical protein